MEPCFKGTLTATEAKAKGMRPLTVGYSKTEHDQSMKANVMADMARDNIAHCIVNAYDGEQVWRTGIVRRDNGRYFR